MKKILTYAFVLLSAVAAQADIMYWMTDPVYADQGATLYATSDPGTRFELGSATAGQLADARDLGLPYWSEVASTYLNDSYSFFIELTNGMAMDPVTYQVAKKFIEGTGVALPSGVNASNAFGTALGGATYAVPEPTSGLLVLIGGMLLGLRRRKVA